MSEVIIKKCPGYNNYSEVRARIFEILDIGLFATKIKPGMNIVVKVNLLAKKLPEQCVTTHPAVAKAICEYIIEHKAIPIIVDSPAGPYNEITLKAIYSATGMDKVAEETGAVLNFDTSSKTVKLNNPKTLDKIEIITPIVNADMVISAAKLKTHVMMTYTGAVKNLYGVIPGLTKASYHMKLQQPSNFANHLIDICEHVKPGFSIIDGIHAMEGDGPNSGTKVEFGYILGSSSAYELDLVAATLIGMEKTDVATILNQEKRGLLKEKNINIVIDDDEESMESINMDFESYKDYVKTMGIKKFKMPRARSVNFLSGRVPKSLENFLVDKSKSKPVFIRNKCIGCGHCVRNCPAKIIHIENKKAVVDIKKCISCFCCHEVCPVHAVEIKVPLIAKFLFKENVK